MVALDAFGAAYEVPLDRSGVVRLALSRLLKSEKVKEAPGV